MNRRLNRPPISIVRRTAATYVDLVLVVLIVGILAAVASPKFNEALEKQQAEAAARRIRDDLMLVRSEAVARSQDLTVAFDAVAESYTVAGLESVDRPGQTYEIVLNQSPYSADLVSVNFGGNTMVTFNRFGDVDSGGAVTVGSTSYQQTVTVNSETGRATIP